MKTVSSKSSRFYFSFLSSFLHDSEEFLTVKVVPWSLFTWHLYNTVMQMHYFGDCAPSPVPPVCLDLPCLWVWTPNISWYSGAMLSWVLYLNIENLWSASIFYLTKPPSLLYFMAFSIRLLMASESLSRQHPHSPSDSLKRQLNISLMAIGLTFFSICFYKLIDIHLPSVTNALAALSFLYSDKGRQLFFASLSISSEISCINLAHISFGILHTYRRVR